MKKVVISQQSDTTSVTWHAFLSHTPYLVVFEINSRIGGIEQHSIWPPAEFVTEWIVGTLWHRKTTTERAVGLHLFGNKEKKKILKINSST